MKRYKTLKEEREEYTYWKKDFLGKGDLYLKALLFDIYSDLTGVNPKNNEITLIKNDDIETSADGIIFVTKTIMKQSFVGKIKNKPVINGQLIVVSDFKSGVQSITLIGQSMTPSTHEYRVEFK